MVSQPGFFRHLYGYSFLEWSGEDVESGRCSWTRKHEFQKESLRRSTSPSAKFRVESWPLDSFSSFVSPLNPQYSRCFHYYQFGAGRIRVATSVAQGALELWNDCMVSDISRVRWAPISTRHPPVAAMEWLHDAERKL